MGFWDKFSFAFNFSIPELWEDYILRVHFFYYSSWDAVTAPSPAWFGATKILTWFANGENKTAEQPHLAQHHGERGKKGNFVYHLPWDTSESIECSMKSRQVCNTSLFQNRDRKQQ